MGSTTLTLLLSFREGVQRFEETATTLAEIGPNMVKIAIEQYHGFHGSVPWLSSVYYDLSFLIDSLLEFLRVKKPDSDCVAIEYSPFKSIHSLIKPQVSNRT